MKNRPEGVVYRRPDGVVIVAPEKAVGMKEIVDSCPYNCISWNEELRLPQKCTLCVHMIEKGEAMPRCVECCATGALVFGDMDDPNSEISRLIAEKRDRLEAFKPEFGTGPTMRYIALPKPFLAGALVLDDECLADAEVELAKASGGETFVANTNFLGDFEFKGLTLNEEYELKINHPGCVPVKITVRVNAGVDVGDVVLSRG